MRVATAADGTLRTADDATVYYIEAGLPTIRRMMTGVSSEEEFNRRATDGIKTFYEKLLNTGAVPGKSGRYVFRVTIRQGQRWKVVSCLGPNEDPATIKPTMCLRYLGPDGTTWITG